VIIDKLRLWRAFWCVKHTRKQSAESTPYFVGGDNLAYLVFACLFAKTNVLNYVDSKNGFFKPIKQFGFCTQVYRV
jgi:hypothetical protein